MESLQLSITGALREDLQNTIKSIEQELELTLPEETRGAIDFVGSGGMYFTKRTLDPEWFKHAIKVVRGYVPYGIEHFDGRFILIATPNQSFSRKNLEVWEKEVLAGWEEIAEAHLWVSSRTLRIQLRADVRRHKVDLGVEARTQQKLDAMYEEIVTALDLEVIPGRPYKVQSSGRYRVGRWRNQIFGEAVESALALFVGQRPVVNEAVILTGKDKKDVVHYDKEPDLSNFINRLKSDKSYTEVALSADGPRGAFFGFHAMNIDVEDEKRKKGLDRTLQLKTSASIEEFPQLVDLFSGLNLKELGVISLDADSTKKETSALRAYTVPIVTAATALVLSSAFWTAFFRQDKLSISVPPTTAQTKETTLSRSKFPVEWIVDKTQWFHTQTDRNAPAMVRILKDGLTEVSRIDNAKPGVPIELTEPGIYDIEVVGASTSVSDKIRVKLETPTVQQQTQKP